MEQNHLGWKNDQETIKVTKTLFEKQEEILTKTQWVVTSSQSQTWPKV